MTVRPLTYQGFKPYNVDPRYRISVQRAWHPAGDRPFYLLYSLTNGLPCLKVLTEEAFIERVNTINNSELSQGKKQKLLGRLAGMCREVGLNSQGKLAIPKDLAEAAQIKAGGEVTQIGRWSYFEIWDKDLFEQNLQLELNEELDDELGIFQ